jgi:hypothetical protein
VPYEEQRFFAPETRPFVKIQQNFWLAEACARVKPESFGALLKLRHRFFYLGLIATVGRKQSSVKNYGLSTKRPVAGLEKVETELVISVAALAYSDSYVVVSSTSK